MEQNSDRMGFALIALVVVAFVLVIMNGVFKGTVTDFFKGFQAWMSGTMGDIKNGHAGETSGVIDGLRAVLGK